MSLSRRELMSHAAWVMAGTVAGSAFAAPTTGARPNILWLVSEDNNPLIGAYGDKLAHTPTIDGLAKKGVLYRNAFSTGPVCAVSRFAILTGMYAETCGAARHHRAVAHLPEEIKTYPQYMREAGYYCTNNWKTDYNCDVNTARIWDDSSPKAQWYNRPAGAPFMSVYNFMTTHESQLFSVTPGRVKPEDVRVPAFLPDSPDVRTDIASYYNLIEKMDGQLAQRLQQLEDKGVADDTIIFYYSDNGGVLPRSKHYGYDEGYRTALVIYVPPKWAHLAPGAPGTVVDTPVSFVDLAPTLLSLIGQPKPKYMQGRGLMGPLAGSPERYAFGGRDRMDERYDFSRSVCDGRYRLIRNYLRDRPGAVHQAYAWQMKSYQDWERRHIAGKLNPAQDRFFKTRPFEEFYDLHEDPDGVRDLMSDPKQAGRIQAMRKALDAHMLEVNDNGFIPEGAAAEGYRESRDPKAYPLPRIMALATLAARRDARNVGALRSALKDGNEVVRYWGAVGLRFLGKTASPARAELQGIMTSDASPHVRIAAAEAVSHFAAAAVPVRHLADILGAPNQTKPLQLQAMDALTYMGPAAKDALPQLKAVAQNKDFEINTAAKYLIAVLEGTYTPETPIFPSQPFGDSKVLMQPPPL